MERLTTRNDTGKAVLKRPYRCERCGEEIWSLSDHGNGEPIDKLAEYEDLEEKGKLLKLPAAIGDEIFFIWRGCPKDYKAEYCRDHEGSCENCHHRIPEIVSRDFRMSDIYCMDKIYSTREEAESELKRKMN